MTFYPFCFKKSKTKEDRKIVIFKKPLFSKVLSHLKLLLLITLIKMRLYSTNYNLLLLFFKKYNKKKKYQKTYILLTTYYYSGEKRK